jgi:hypothetical protein
MRATTNHNRRPSYQRCDPALPQLTLNTRVQIKTIVYVVNPAHRT